MYSGQEVGPAIFHGGMSTFVVFVPIAASEVINRGNGNRGEGACKTNSHVKTCWNGCNGIGYMYTVASALAMTGSVFMQRFRLRHSVQNMISILIN